MKDQKGLAEFDRWIERLLSLPLDCLISEIKDLEQNLATLKTATVRVVSLSEYRKIKQFHRAVSEAVRIHKHLSLEKNQGSRNTKNIPHLRLV